MKLVVRALADQRAELLSRGLRENTRLVWIGEEAAFAGHRDADAWLDLAGPGDGDGMTKRPPQGLPRYAGPSCPLVLLGSMSRLEGPVTPHADTDAVRGAGEPAAARVVRINAWPGMLERPLVEAAGPGALQAQAEAVLACFNRTVEWTPDIPGFISGRVLAAIINEAYFALQDQVSSRDGIDTAMQLGTGYPLGPFAWCRRIGVRRIHQLLLQLAGEDSRYQPCPLLEQEADLSFHGTDSSY
ncbi:MAG TPA: 3-hydroxyacyl-CoA dehydrogenase family protein [Chitinophagaceae bacterium]|nr:3-hydroxyacyl-CoA dehydrogenase family protein [Chitinophagaceae bacterium]